MTRLEGPVELIGGELVLQIPLEDGGRELIACSRGLGRVEGNVLIIPIWPKLAADLGISEGTRVVVDDENGKFNLFVAD
jgi:hypothetical protein